MTELPTVWLSSVRFENRTGKFLVVHKIYLADSIDPGDPVFFLLSRWRARRTKTAYSPEGRHRRDHRGEISRACREGGIQATFEKKNLRKWMLWIVCDGYMSCNCDGRLHFLCKMSISVSAPLWDSSCPQTRPRLRSQVVWHFSKQKNYQSPLFNLMQQCLSQRTSKLSIPGSATTW